MSTQKPTTRDCVTCGTDVPTIAETPLCGKSCRLEWLKETFNDMTDEEAHCPLCNEDKHSVKTAVRHCNDKHDTVPHIRRTETCQECGTTFVPKNYDNPNKYCSDEHFLQSGAPAKGSTSDGLTAYQCSTEGCNRIRVIRTSYYKLMNDEPACSYLCSRPRGEDHPRWEGGSEEIRKQPEYREWRTQVHQSRDDCAQCGETELLQAHHIIPLSINENLAYDTGNGILLCSWCHSEAHPEMSKEMFLR